MAARSSHTKTPHLKWFLALAGLLIGAAMYMHGIVQNLPYHLDSDEPFTWLFVDRLLLTGSLYDPAQFIPYPPLRLVLGALEQHYLYLATPAGALTQPVAYLTARLFSVFYGVLLLAVTYQAGRQLHSPAAGIGAMLFLAVQPDAIKLSKIFKTDDLAWLLGMACIVFTIRAIRSGRGSLNIYGFLFAAGAIAAKYTMAPVLGFPLVGTVLVAGRKSYRYAAGAILILIVVSALIISNPPDLLIRLLRILPTGVLFGRQRFFQFVSLSANSGSVISQVGIVNLLMLPAGLLLAVTKWSRPRLDSRQWMLVVIVAVMMVGTLFSLSLLDRPSRHQDLFVIVLGFALIWGVALAVPVRRRASLAMLIALVLLSSRMVSGWTIGSDLLRPDTRVMTAEWFIHNVPAGIHIAVESDKVEFEQGYGGFPSDKTFFVDEINSVYQESLDSFARRGIEYLVADEREFDSGGFYDPGIAPEAFLSQVEQVSSLDDPSSFGWAGPRRIIFRIPAIQQNPMHDFFGSAIIFKGYDLPKTTIAAGESLDLVLYWAALEKTSANNIVFAQLLNDQGRLVAQLDGPPGDALHRTYDWWPGYFDWDEWPVPVPNDLPDGMYRLILGMYDADSLERLPIISQDGAPLGDHIELTSIEIRR